MHVGGGIIQKRGRRTGSSWRAPSDDLVQIVYIVCLTLRREAKPVLDGVGPARTKAEHSLGKSARLRVGIGVGADGPGVVTDTACIRIDHRAAGVVDPDAGGVQVLHSSSIVAVADSASRAAEPYGITDSDAIAVDRVGVAAIVVRQNAEVVRSEDNGLVCARAKRALLLPAGEQLPQVSNHLPRVVYAMAE